MLTDQKVPVRLTLHRLSAQCCRTYALRHYFLAGGNHSKQHPLMFQIGSNADCISFGITAGGRLAAHCFFHFRENTPRRKRVLLHNFMVHPHLRNRGIGSLLAIQLLREVLTPIVEEVIFETDFPRPEFQPGIMKRLWPDSSAADGVTLSGAAVVSLVQRLEQEEQELGPAILTNLITQPEYVAKLEREEIFIGAVSQSNTFFESITALEWPRHAVVQPVKIEGDRCMGKDAGELDLLLVDISLIGDHPDLLPGVAGRFPHLPVVAVGNPSIGPSPSLLFQSDAAGLLDRLTDVLRPYEPEQSVLDTKPVRWNLLRLPERGPIAVYKNRHEGGRIFIVASGPSLEAVDPSLFGDEITMTINDALLKFPDSAYAAIMDLRKLHDLHQELLRTDTVFTLEGNSFGVELKYLGTEGFNTKLEDGIYSGYTTAFFALQIAIYMGFKEIYFLGLDLGNTEKKSHFFGTRPLQDQDRPDVYAKMCRSFVNISGQLNEMGVRVYNCSPVSALKEFPYRSVDELLAPRAEPAMR